MLSLSTAAQPAEGYAGRLQVQAAPQPDSKKEFRGRRAGAEGAGPLEGELARCRGLQGRPVCAPGAKWTHRDRSCLHAAGLGPGRGLHPEEGQHCLVGATKLTEEPVGRSQQEQTCLRC